MTTKNNRLFFLCTGQAVAVDFLPKHPGSHIIGELIRVLDESVLVTALALYEASVTATSPPEKLPEIRAEIIGDSRKIRCTCCDHQSRWHIGKAAIKNIVRMYVNE